MQQPAGNQGVPRWLGTVALVLAITAAALAGLYGPLARILGIALAFPLLVLGLQLFYRLPLRGRGVGSKVFWRVWAITCAAMLVTWLLVARQGGADL